MIYNTETNYRGLSYWVFVALEAHMLIHAGSMINCWGKCSFTSSDVLICLHICSFCVVIKQKHWITFQFHWWGSSAVIFRALRVFHFDRGTSPEPFDAKILKMQRMHRGLKAIIKGWYWFVKGNMQAVCRVILNVGNVKFYLYWQRHFWYGDISASTSVHLLPSVVQLSPASVLCVFCVLSLLQSRERQDRARPRDGGDAYQCLCVWVWGCVLPLPWRRHYHRRTSLWSHPLQNLNACGRTLVEGADSLSKWIQIILKVSICNRGYKNTEKADENCYNSVLTWTLATFIDFKMKTNNVPVCSLLRPVMSSTWQM